MAYRAQFEQWVPLPLEQVFQFFGNPQNFPRIMPEWMQVRLEKLNIVAPPDVSPDNVFAGMESTITASYRAIPLLPYRISSEARIIGFGLNQFFEDTQVSGPFKRWRHRHEFAAETRNGVAGAVVRDSIEYEIGLEPLGSIVNAFFVGPQLELTFAYRHDAVERLLGLRPEPEPAS